MAAYAPTPAWVAGIFQIVPVLGSLLAIIGALYSLYLLYLGLHARDEEPAGQGRRLHRRRRRCVAIVSRVVASYITTMFGARAGGMRLDSDRCGTEPRPRPRQSGKSSFCGSGSQKLATKPMRYAHVPTSAPA